MSSKEQAARPSGAPTGHIGVIDTSAFHEPGRRHLATVALAVLCVIAANAFVASGPFWRIVRDSEAVQYSGYDPVALQLPGNQAPPAWARGAAVIIGASNVGMGLPVELSEDLLGERVWTLWAAGVNPPELLGMAPLAVRAGVDRAIVALEVQYVSTGADTDFSILNRDVYVGPTNPAWTYRWELAGGGWREPFRALPLFRLRKPLHDLAGSYVVGKLIERRRPFTEPWRAEDMMFEREITQQALAAYRAEPTVARYEAYQDAVATAHDALREQWANMRRVTIDPTLQSVNARALKDLTAYLRGHDVAVGWVLFPENPIYGRVLGPDGNVIAPAEIVPEARAVLARFAEQEQVPYVDLLDLCEPDEFLDLFHVIPTARPKLGAALQPLLAELAEG